MIPIARSHLPELLVLGEYDPGRRSSSAIWLRFVLERASKLPDIPVDRPPIIYLPGVERGQLRAGEGCPEALCADGLPAGPGLDIAEGRGHR